MYQQKLYQLLAGTIQAKDNCIETNNEQWFDKHSETIEILVSNFLPSGSGFDSGTTLDLDQSTPNKLVLHFGYHHMDTYGSYDGWSNHMVTVTPSLAFEIDLDISDDPDYYKAKLEDYQDALKDNCSCGAGNKNSLDHAAHCDVETWEYYPPEFDQDVDYFHDTFHHALNQLIDYSEIEKRYFVASAERS